jgi:hypothetical protein
MLSIRDYLVKLEMELMVGGGRWVADFSESFWDRTIGDVRFQMVITGGMRGQGFFLSRIANMFFIPNYAVACFAYAADRQIVGLQPVLQTIERFRKDNELAWCWLVIPSEAGCSRRDKLLIQHNDTRELGMALVDLGPQEITTSSSYIGRRMGRYVRCFR